MRMDDNPDVPSVPHTAARPPRRGRPGAGPPGGGDDEASRGPRFDGAPRIGVPEITLPKAGGAIRGIGEKFAVNPATGTGNISVPIAVSPGRSGFNPHLTLSYDSGNGNGPFGFGWSLTAPSITRKTDKGLPRYADGEESDVFLISDAEDLVPALDGSDGWSRMTETEPPHAPGYRIDRYRPRMEGLFARIERWTSADGDSHWRSITRDNVTTLYGVDETSRVYDPSDPQRVFQWLISSTFDDRGNAMSYHYVAEDGAGVDVAASHERHRGTADRSANRYLKRIRYGNRVSRLTDPDDPQWMFEVVFDYGDHDADTPTPGSGRPWPCRTDPFSTYRAGFEVRTYRLCRRVLMFHRFPTVAEVGADCLVRSVDFTYAPGDAVGTFLTAITQHGYRRDGAGYVRRSLPPVEFGYQPAQISDEVREIDPASLTHAPTGIGSGYRFIDLDGDGIAGILAERRGGWYYKPNLGGGRFAPAHQVATLPAPAAAGQPGVQLLDLAGDGSLDVAVLGGAPSGFFERTDGGDWAPFTAFGSVPTVDWADPDLRFVDLDGDGRSDVLLTEDAALTWYPALGEEGFGPPRREPLPHDENAGPRVVFADGTETIHLADMSGDGLADLVRIRNGEVSYWPNLGYGRFGARVAMDDAPWLDRAELFDPRRVRLTDVDGSGVQDLIYVGADGVRVYLNRSGNGWTQPRRLPAAPPTPDPDAVSAVDLFGNGTTCLVWSSDRPGDERRSLRYVDLMDGRKPHLMTSVVNNLGAETHVGYTSSTHFLLADRTAGRPWLTRLPFPVQVVERVETRDRISGNRFVSRYAYHHGYFDGEEREFRGFGMVEQWDTEDWEVTGGASNEGPATDVPPVLTRTWYHTGWGADGVSPPYRTEYWPEPGLTEAQRAALLLDDTVLPDVLRRPDGTTEPHRPTTEELREACRALKGSVLRREIYGLDGTPDATNPYTVEERNYTVELLQPRRGTRHAVCLAVPRETVSYDYDRRRYAVERDGDTVLLADPRVTHEVVLDVGPFGNVRRKVAVNYGRRLPGAGVGPELPEWSRVALRAAQAHGHATLTELDCTDPIDTPAAYRGPQPWQKRVYELLHTVPDAVPEAPTALLRRETVREHADAASDGDRDLPYEDVEATGATEAGPYRRIVEHVRTRYRRDDLSGELPFGESGTLALPYENYQLALTPGLVASTYATRVADPVAVLGGEAGYTLIDGAWWAPSGRARLSPDAADTAAQELAFARRHFFLPRRFRNPFGQATVVAFDGFDLLPTGSTDALGNATAATPDYRTLQPRQVTDPNGNRSAVLFDALGMITATAVMGKPGENAGDTLTGLSADLMPTQVAAGFADPLAAEAGLLGRASTRLVYDLFAYHRTRGDAQPLPAATHTLTRQVHDADGGPPNVLHTFSYSDGFGREIQRKARAEDGPLVDGGPVASPRWIAGGVLIYNNKGKAVREYEPAFSPTHGFTDADPQGVSTVLFYDPIERVVATLRPDRTYHKVVFDPWREASWDGNDTVLLDPRTDPDVARFTAGYFTTQPADCRTWHAERTAAGADPLERDAATKTERHAGTPSRLHLDPLGRPILAVSHNAFDRDGTLVEERYATLTVLDIEGGQLRATDARGRLAGQRRYDVLGSPVRVEDADSGARHTLTDATGAVIRSWDSRGHEARTVHDALRRPVRSYVRTGAGPFRLLMRTVYGEAHPDAADRNLRTRVHLHLDGAGAARVDRADFKGNVLTSTRRLATGWNAVPDWSTVDAVSDADLIAALPAGLENEEFTTAGTFDAQNRPATMTTPDGSVVRAGYNAAGLLETLDARIAGAAQETPFVTGVWYDAHGRRTAIAYGNDTGTAYRYDPATFRLTELTTTAAGGATVQALRYTYDPAGNPVRIRDAAQQTVFFAGAVVEPDAGYTYDATYRLIEATGREHIGQADDPRPPWRDREPAGLPHPNDLAAMRRYREHYRYDEVDNLIRMIHEATGGNWTRTYDYAGPGNRLTGTRVGAGPVEPYGHDDAGNMITMPHLDGLDWDHTDRLRRVGRLGGGAVHYHYAGDGRRVRKVVERPNGTRAAERIYLAGFEIYREYGADGTTRTLERQTLHVLDDARRVAMVDRRTAGDDGTSAQLIRYQVENHLNSSCVELDGAGDPLTYAEYAPYGRVSFTSARAGAIPPKRYGYLGRERDEETGFGCHGVRYYAPWLGRWTSADPAGFVEGTNRYAYSQDNPIARSDPGGRQSVSEPNYDLGPLRLSNFQLTGGNFSGSFSLGFDRNGLTVNSAQAAGRVRLSADSSVPSLGLTGRAGLTLNLESLRVGGGAASLDAGARTTLSAGPLSANLNLSLNGTTTVPQIRFSAWREDLGSVLTNFRGEALAAGHIDVGGTTIGYVRLGATIREGGTGTLSLSGRLGLPNFGSGPSTVIGSFGGQGTFAGSSYQLNGSFTAGVPPVAFTTGRFSLSSGEGLRVQAHYLGPLFGPIGLTPSFDPLAAFRPANYGAAPSDANNPAPPGPPPPGAAPSPGLGSVSLFQPGFTLGYSYLQLNQGRTTSFSLGFSPRASVREFSLEQPLPFPLDTVPGLDQLLYGRPLSTPAGWYLGASFRTTF
jgi:RHS repeat-associated protein